MTVERNIAEACDSLVNKPLFATSYERHSILDEIKSEFADLPQPRRFARFLSILLSRVSLPLKDYDLIAGRNLDRELNAAEEERFQAFLHHKDYPRRRVMLDSGHCTYDWEHLMEHGLAGLRAIAEKRLAGETDPEKRDFLLGAVEAYSAVIDYTLRYADAAQKKGMDDLAAALREAAGGKPGTFRGALQMLWIVTLIDCAYITLNPTLTLGRLDQLLLPLYRRGIADGTLTREEAAAYITDYYCKHNLIMGRGEHQVGGADNSTTFNRILCFDAPQYLLLGGTDREGKDAVNELTELFAECIVPAFKNPVVVVRYTGGMNTAHPELWNTLMRRALDSASLMFYNDDNVSAAFRRMGFSDADAREYSHFGCNWPSPGATGAWMQGGPGSRVYGSYLSDEERQEMAIPYMRCNCEHSWPEDFLLALGTLKEKENATIDDLYDAFFARMGDFIDRKLAHLSRELEIRRRHPARVMTFGDLFFRDSIADAACFSAGAKYHFELQAFQMFGTVADCFITADELIFRRHALTVSELLTATEADFVGYESILALCRSVPKYGSDTELSNAHAARLSKRATDMVFEKSHPYFKREKLFLTPCMQSDTWHLKLGETFGATPDGRRAGKPFSQNTKPSNGACTNGLTGMFNAMLHLPHDGLMSGALNLDVEKKNFAGEEGLRLFGTLLGTYLNGGGLHAQVSAIDVCDLIDAQENPDAHRDLRVRVTGYSGIFVDICKRLQDDIIDRMK